MAYNGVPRPTYQKVTPRRKLDEIAKSAEAITRQPLAPGSDARPAAEIKIRK